ncbi:hypothetical protein EUX98_g2503 [Antrodiella citrinella]|uniref:Uncharacterized protein n=1 Tax=Antrodiella citrinella TaxID=2447956 RepID=A0A4S4N131_9APHY|nr:hypothetical protein EUX98_g2503 [Antrodiella citrinella]
MQSQRNASSITNHVFIFMPTENDTEGPGTVVNSADDLPPPRQRQGIRSVSPPLAHVSVRKFNYYIALAAGILFAVYAYRIIQWKSEAGSWWNLALGKRPPVVRNMQNAQANWAASKTGSGNGNGAGKGGEEKDFGDSEVERRINELAAALGIPSKDLASAIAGAVKENVPPASLSSIAAHQTGEAVQRMVNPDGAPVAEPQPGAYDAVTAAIGAAVGMDEPPTGDLS